MKKIINKHTIAYMLVLVVATLSLGGCSKQSEANEVVEVDVEKTSSQTTRSNEIVCLEPVPLGTNVLNAPNLVIDVSNASEGYFYLIYSGDNEDVKMQISCDGSITYTYKIGIGDTVIPLTLGSGTYSIVVYESMGNSQYSSLFADQIDVEVTNEYGPCLYPNYYVNFTADSQAIELGKELAANCTCDLEVIGAVYDYVIANISYDYEEAETVATSYVPDIDEILDTKKGICFDYAALMSAILRSQRIPTRLEVGYAGDAYHAWITTYIEDIGWINGMIQFDGADWTLMDPTFAANSDKKTLTEFVGDGNNYTTKYIY